MLCSAVPKDSLENFPETGAGGSPSHPPGMTQEPRPACGLCYPLTVWSNSKAGSGWPAVGSNEAKWVSRPVICDKSEARSERAWVARVLGLGSDQTAWTWLHKMRRAMIVSGRDRFTGAVEVDEAFIGAPEEDVHGP